MKKHFIAALLSTLTVSLGAEPPRLLSLPTNGETRLLHLSGKGGEKIVDLTLLKGTVELTTIVGEDHDENPKMVVTEGNTISVECHAISVKAMDGEVRGYYQIKEPVAGTDQDQETEARIALKLSVAEKASAHLKAAAAAKAAARLATDTPTDATRAAAATAATAAAKAKSDYEDARAVLDAS